MDYRIKDLPRCERPREKLSSHGPAYMTDVELLSIILRTGTKGKNVKELSSEILNTYTLKQLANRSVEDMKMFKGISEVKAGQIVAAGELSKRMKNENLNELNTFTDVKAKVQDMKFLEDEKMRVFYLDSGNQILGEKEFEGSVSAVDFETQKVLRPAVKKNSAALIMAHNHPSGKSNPSNADIEATPSIIAASKNLGLTLLDHIIIGREIRSMRSDTAVFDTS